MTETDHPKLIYHPGDPEPDLPRTQAKKLEDPPPGPFNPEKTNPLPPPSPRAREAPKSLEPPKPVHTTVIAGQPVHFFNIVSPANEPVMILRMPAIQLGLPGHAPDLWSWDECDGLAAELSVDLKNAVVAVIQRWGEYKSKQENGENPEPTEENPDA